MLASLLLDACLAVGDVPVESGTVADLATIKDTLVVGYNPKLNKLGTFDKLETILGKLQIYNNPRLELEVTAFPVLEEMLCVSLSSSSPDRDAFASLKWGPMLNSPDGPTALVHFATLRAQMADELKTIEADLSFADIKIIRRFLPLDSIVEVTGNVNYNG